MRYRALIVALVALCIGFITACSDGSTASGGKDIMTYEQIRGTGLANKCPQLAETSRGSIAIDPDGSYKRRSQLDLQGRRWLRFPSYYRSVTWW